MYPFPSLPDFKTCLVFAAGIGIVLFARSVSAHRKRNPRRLPLPPGPKGLPIIGNMLQIPMIKPWEGYAAMSKQYHGELVYLEALGQGILVVGTLPRVADLLEKRAVNNSDRPSAAAIEMIDMGWTFGLMPYGMVWKQHRRVFHRYLNHNAVTKYHPLMYEETNNLLRTLRSDPQGFIANIKIAFGTMIMRTAYGFDDIGKNRSLIHDSEILANAATQSTAPGKFLVNIFPILKYVPEWFPGAGFQTYFKEMSKMNKRVLNQPFDNAKKDTSNGKRSVYPSMAAELIDSLPEEGHAEFAELEYAARGVCASAYIAGAETIVSLAIIIIYVMATHPEVQKKAQAEIDAVIGSDRLPTFEDRETLPYVEAIIKEVSRWYTIVPLGIPHTSMEDDEYDGYFIPKGTFIMANSWAIMHDPERFEKPFDFIPERYIKNGQIDPSVPDGETAAFGFGRRICPGRFFANKALFLFTVSLLSVYNITPPKDDAGNPIAMKLGCSDLTVAKPLPFECEITLRSGRESLLHES